MNKTFLLTMLIIGSLFKPVYTMDSTALEKIGFHGLLSAPLYYMFVKFALNCSNPSSLSNFLANAGKSVLCLSSGLAINSLTNNYTKSNNFAFKLPNTLPETVYYAYNAALFGLTTGGGTYLCYTSIQFRQ